MITQEQLKEVLAYDGDTGVFTWKDRDLNWWNTKYSGKVAGTISTGGYVAIRIKGKTYSAHRLAWLYVYDYFPVEVDHIDGNGLNNIICNIRDVSHIENMKNQKNRKNNTSGTIGVHLSTKTLKWQAKISILGKQVRLGYFTDKQDAIDARKAAEIKYGYHANHGRL